MSQDREFDNYIQGNSGLSDLYAELPDEKLPSHLDAAILAEAHRAVGARPGKQRRSWVIPLSMAASLFVVVIIGLQLPYLLPKDSVPSQVRQEEKTKAATVDEAAQEKSAPANNQAGIPPAVPAPMAPPAKAVVPSAGTPQLVSPEPAREQKRLAQSADNKPKDAVSVAPAAPAEVTAAGAGKPLRLDEQAESRNRVILKKEKSSDSRAEGITADKSAQPAPTVAAMAAPEAVGQASEPQAETKADMVNLSPKEWLARIRQLKKQGRTDEAKKELAAFRKRYPDYSVPKDIETR